MRTLPVNVNFKANATYTDNPFAAFQKTNINNLQLSQQNTPDNKTTVKENNNEKPLIYAGVALAATAVAGLSIFCLVKKRQTPPLLQPTKIPNLSDTIEYFKKNGVAYKKGQVNDLYTGKVKKVFNDGSELILEYKDGIIQKSQRSGSKSFEKIYERNNGELIVKTLKDGKTTENNITVVANEVRKQQEELKNILKNSSTIPVAEFDSQISQIKYISKRQKGEIDKIYNQHIKHCIISDKLEEAVEYVHNANLNQTYMAASSDTAEELNHWLNKRMTDNKLVSDNLRANYSFDDFEIKPHSYADDTDIFVHAKCCGTSSRDNSDWNNYYYKPGSNDTYLGHSSIAEEVRDWGARRLLNVNEGVNPIEIAGNLFTTSDKKGRKIVYFSLNNVEMEKGIERADRRAGCSEFVLYSKNGEFTQLQKDVMRIFADENNKKYVKNHPIQVFLNHVFPSTKKGHRYYENNKTALLSAIQSWANNSKQTNVNDIISSCDGILSLSLK